MDNNTTVLFNVSEVNEKLIKDTLRDALESLEERGYNPINQLVGYIISGDLGYISSYKEARNRIKNNNDPRFIEVVFSSLEYRIRFMLESVLPKVYWYSYLRTGEEYNIKEAEIIFNGSEDEKEHSKIINLKNINLDDIPPFHPFCDCKVKFKIKKGGR